MMRRNREPVSTSKMRPGSPREVGYLRDAALSPDKLWTLGSQAWVNGPVDIGAQMKVLADAQRTLSDKLARLGADQAAERQAITSELDELQSAIEVLDHKLARFTVGDNVGFTTDMMNKAIRHMDPENWGELSAKFENWENPRQAAKAAARALRELPGGPGAHGELMNGLNAVAKGNAIPDDGLRQRVNRAFHEAFKIAVEADRQVDEALLETYTAAVDSGNAAAIFEARGRLAARQRAARRIEATLQAVTEAEGAEAVLHEWMTGERLRRIGRPGRPPAYQVLDGAGHDAPVIGRRSASEVEETALEFLHDEARRMDGVWPRPSDGHALPSFRPFDPGPPTLWGEILGAPKKIGLLGWLAAGYGAHVGADVAARALRQPVTIKDAVAPARTLDVPDWSEIVSGEITAEQMRSWFAATGLGTALAVGELTGVVDVVREMARGETASDKAVGGRQSVCEVLVICMIYDAGKWYAQKATHAEIEAAQREGRDPSRLNILRDIISDQLARRARAKVRDALRAWGRQRAEHAWALREADFEDGKVRFQTSRLGTVLEQTLGAGGVRKLTVRLDELRLRSAAIQEAWGTGTDALDRAILSSQTLKLALAARDATRLDDACRAILERLDDGAEEAASAEARADWAAAVRSHRDAVAPIVRVAAQTLGDASYATAVFGDAGVWQSDLARHDAVRIKLAELFARLTLALPENAELAAWHAEIESTRYPVSIELRLDLVSEARRIALAADRAVDGMARLPDCGVLNRPGDGEEGETAEETSAPE